jgi:hypothetical protein
MSLDDEGTRRRNAKNVRKQLREAEANLATRKRASRCYRLCLTWLSAAAVALAASISLGDDSKIASEISVLCIILAVASAAVIVGVWIWDRNSPVPTRVEIEVVLEDLRDQVRWIEAGRSMANSISQHLYKADIPSFIEQFKWEGDKYRKRHNRLQSIVIVGSLSTTTIASLGSAVPAGRWLTVGFSFTVGLAAGFMGYFKFRERSFYLQQTADAIEAEDNAMTLGIGEYQKLAWPDALAKLVDRIEYLRNEQRRRQQQLDQPVEGQNPGLLTNAGPVEQS